MTSKPIYRHYGKIEKGDLVFHDPNFFWKQISSLDGKEFELVIKERFRKVSSDTHAYYRGAIIPECLRYEIFGGWTEDEVHKFFQQMFLSREVAYRTMDGYITKQEVVSTASISQKEMNEYVDKVLHWLSTEGIVILTPEQYYLEKYKTR